MTAPSPLGYDDGYTRAPTDLAIVAIIPARYGSTRLPGKPLSDIHGKTLIERVHERVRGATTLDRILVATDDERVAAAVRRFGADRLAEAARSLEAEIVVNVQGDEPMLDPAGVDAAVRALKDEPGLEMSTLSLPLGDAEKMLSPSVVKVVTDAAGNALYFSRSPIPFVRLGSAGDMKAEEAVRRRLARKHVGLYAYRREALRHFASLPQAPLEEAEGLEQLRALHHGMRIRVVPMDGVSGVAVDTPRDLERVRALLRPERGTRD